MEQLQERLKHLVHQDGALWIDLQNFTIDLRPENAEFRDSFYQLLQKTFSQSQDRISLNLSHSRIQGEFLGNRLGTRVPLLAETLQSVFSEADLLDLLSEAAHLPLQVPHNQTTSLPEITVIRGRIACNQTQFERAVSFQHTFFLRGFSAVEANFQQKTDWHGARFNQTANFSQAVFQQDSNFQKAVFLSNGQFRQVNFQKSVIFEEVRFQTAHFNEAHFQETADFQSTQWADRADFRESWWEGQAIFSKSRFAVDVDFSQALFQQSLDFRRTQFKQGISLKEASIQQLVDFSDVGFSHPQSLNLANLMFDSTSARILGDPGFIGRVISVPILQGNENLLRNLIKNFRQQEQIEDANQIELLRAELRLKMLKRNLLGINLNTASIAQLVRVGFSSEQAQAILQTRQEQPFRDLTEILQLPSIDLTTYLNIYDRVVVNPQKLLQPAKKQFQFFQQYILPIIRWFLNSLRWLSLSILLLLSGYGTRFNLVFGVGIVAIAYFGLLFWGVDRYRKWRPRPILPTQFETIAMAASFGLAFILGLLEIFGNSPQPWLTLISLGCILLPIPGILLGLLYQQGRYHNLMEVSYLSEDASLRQLRLMIGRLPVLPRYPLFRERYMPVLWEKRWSWLNYYDFSLNNFLKFGFNDVRLRDECLPGLVTSLVWYQWGLGVIYLSILFWTLSRTIPGLNLLIYLK
ncbi:MAG: pentapeptide repeat-containing protein [Microcoleaceae cyanobacterium]